MRSYSLVMRSYYYRQRWTVCPMCHTVLAHSVKPLWYSTQTLIWSHAPAAILSSVNSANSLIMVSTLVKSEKVCYYTIVVPAYILQILEILKPCIIIFSSNTEICGNMKVRLGAFSHTSPICELWGGRCPGNIGGALEMKSTIYM